MRVALAAGFYALLVAAPAFAACDDDLGDLDARVAREARKAVATSSSGQATAAKRDGQAMQARDAQVPASAVAGAPAAGTAEARSTDAAAAAGGAGDRVMQAKATINEARVAKGKGDEAGCLAAVGKAKAQLDD